MATKKIDAKGKKAYHDERNDDKETCSKLRKIMDGRPGVTIAIHLLKQDFSYKDHKRDGCHTPQQQCTSINADDPPECLCKSIDTKIIHIIPSFTVYLQVYPLCFCLHSAEESVGQPVVKHCQNDVYAHTYDIFQDFSVGP